MQDWDSTIRTMDYAFQPIVDIRTGLCIGYEALLRGHASAGFASIDAVFDAAYADRSLFKLDILLREKAIERFTSIPHHSRVTLFYNLDGRVLDMPDYVVGRTRELLRARGLDSESLCFEVSERHELASSETVRGLLEHYRSQEFRIALDDYGTGCCGLRTLYRTEPHFLKIDRFFIDHIQEDARKQRIVETVVNLSHGLGIHVVAEGVETPEELRACRELGCDSVQGYLICRPTLKTEGLPMVYEVMHDDDAMKDAAAAAR